MGPFLCSASLLSPKAGHLCVSAQRHRDSPACAAFWSTVVRGLVTVPCSVKVGASFVDRAVPDTDLIWLLIR